MKKKLLAFVLMLVSLVSLLTTVASAAVAENETVMPCFTNVMDYTMDFYVTSGGQLCVMADYKGESGVFTQARITVKIQKKFLGVFWRTVDIGYTDNEWIEYCSELNGSFINTFDADGTGTYRAKIKLEVAGMFGTDDVIEKTIECVYG